MKILIIENVWLGTRKYGRFEKRFLTMFTILPTLQARHIAAITPKKHQVEVLNERYKKIDFEEKFDIVNINFTTSTAPRAYEIADKLKEKKVTVVLSGLHPSGLPEEALKHADSVLLGWGELNWLEFLKDFEKGKIKTIYQPIRYDDKVRLPPTPIDLPGIVLTGAVEATRGCPYKCDFCREGNIPGGSQFYKRPVEDVIDEIKELPQKSFTFYDNSMTIDPTYSKSLFKDLIPLKKRFSCNGNADILAKDEELVELSKKAGCTSWLIGFESITQAILDDIGKKTNQVQDYKKAVDNIHKNRMIAIGCFIFGFDNETNKVFDDSYKMIQDLELDVADFLVLTPFPGTPLFERMKKDKRIIDKDWSEYNMRNVVYKPKNLTNEELSSGVKNLYKKYYSLPTTLKRILRRANSGFYPFILSFERNLSGYLNKRRL